jgi:DNA-binding LacI/PurR family transcriptional regulator
MILLSTLRDDPVAELLHRHSFPFVVIGHPCHGENYHRVDSDNEKAGRMVTEYLLKYGHRRICYMGADDSLSVTVKRQAGFEAALRDAGIHVDQGIFLSNPLSQGDDSLPAILQKPGGPTAVVAQDDAMAIWLIGALQKEGRRVPGDVSIISFNNTAISAYTTPPLTTVEVHPYLLGEQAMELLYRLLKEPATKPQWVEVPVKLMERGSVCYPPK